MPKLRARAVRGVGFAVAVAISVAGWAACASGTMAASKMACCEAAEHECHTEGSAEQCCDTGEQSQQTYALANKVDPLFWPMTGSSDLWQAEPFVPPDARVLSRAFEATFRKLPHEPSYVLTSVLLI